MFRFVYALVIALTFTMTGSALATTESHPEESPTSEAKSKKDKLVIGTKHAPPFSMRLEDGTWIGISIDLWRAVAADLNLDYEIREFDLEGLIQATEQNKVSIAVSAIGMTAERNAIIEFSYPFFRTLADIKALFGPGHL